MFYVVLFSSFFPEMQLVKQRSSTSRWPTPCQTTTNRPQPPKRQSRTVLGMLGTAAVAVTPVEWRERAEQGGELLKGDDAWGHGEGLAHGQTLLAVDEEGVVLDGQVGLEGGLGAQQLLQGVLGVAQLGLQGFHGVGDLADLLNQPEDNRKGSQS